MRSTTKNGYKVVDNPPLAVGRRGADASHDEFIIERKGKPLAALVPVERLEQMRRFARTQALDFLEQQKGNELTDAQAADLALEAQAWARRPARKRTRRAK